MNKTKEKFLQRKRRVAAKVRGTKERPRLSVFRSNRFIYAQIIDDTQGKTLVAFSSKNKEVSAIKKRQDRAFKVGEAIGKKAIAKKIKKVVFDKSGYKYHGIIKALADGARKAGLEF